MMRNLSKHEFDIKTELINHSMTSNCYKAKVVPSSYDPKAIPQKDKE